ncbi:MAG: sodium:proton antiporter [Phycisphaerales bacterium]|nr:sodium:proton antiporter [Phycisphaerales bacterium]
MLTLASTDSMMGIALAMIIILGVGAQWLAWKIKIPSILLLLIFGILAGPVMRSVFDHSPFAIDPDELFNRDMLLAAVGIAVGLILYEGGLTLNFKELQTTWKPVTLLVTTGALVTWIIAGISAYYLFDLERPIAILLGAILIVTGPTVVGPMLAHIRPSGNSGLILKWEGIVIDPIGVGAAVFVFEAISSNSSMNGVSAVVQSLLITLGAGLGLGIFSAFLLKTLLTRFWIPDYLQNPVSLMLVIATFTASNQIMSESGLLATTVMGIAMANQKKVDVHHILEFKENLRVLLIAVLFIVLAARLQIDQLAGLDWFTVFGFLFILIFIARPIAVFLATVGAGLSWRERMFIAWIAPRGIVAAAAASIFSLGLEKEQISGSENLVPLTFSVIIGTVAFYGLTTPWAAKILGVADQNPQGIIFIGASKWARSIAKVLSDRGFKVLLIDTNRQNIRDARMAHLPAIQDNILSMGDISQIDLRGIGRTFATTPNDEVNTLALQRFKGYFESSNLFQLPPRKTKKGSDESSGDRRWRMLFGADADYAGLESKMHNGWIVKATTISEEFTYDDYRTLYGSSVIPLFTISSAGILTISTLDKPIEPIASDTIIALVNPEELFVIS